MCFDTHFPKLRGYCDKFAENVICVCPAYQITSHKSKNEKPRERESGKDKLDMRMDGSANGKKYTTFVEIFVDVMLCTEFCELHVNFPV
jgi:hypothetical protein